MEEQAIDFSTGVDRPEIEVAGVGQAADLLDDEAFEGCTDLG